MFGFHVVRLRQYCAARQILEHKGYEIYLNNKPFIRLKDGLKLKRHEAYKFAKQLNGF